VTATNLAVSLAHDLESKVLLIDCDLRKGTVDNLLNVSHRPGLSEYLNDKAELNSVIHKTKIHNLFVIPAGDTLTTPSELLGSKKMKALLETLKTHSFSYIILDTPPVLPFSDAAVLGAQTDGVLLVVKSRKTQAHTVRKTKESLQNGRANLLGFILTQADHASMPYYGDYYYYYDKKNQTSEKN
jgi:capsular exopolysaccharide synthesis family protein